MLIDADWSWLMLIDADWCWLALNNADWCWLMLIEARIRFNQVFFCRSVTPELLRSFFFKVLMAEKMVKSVRETFFNWKHLPMPIRCQDFKSACCRHRVYSGIPWSRKKVNTCNLEWLTKEQVNYHILEWIVTFSQGWFFFFEICNLMVCENAI